MIDDDIGAAPFAFAGTAVVAAAVGWAGAVSATAAGVVAVVAAPPVDDGGDAAWR